VQGSSAGPRSAARAAFGATAAVGQEDLPPSRWVRAGRAIRDALPQGQTLPPEAWRARHRALLAILWAHVIILPLFSLSQGFSLGASIVTVMPIALAGIAGSLERAPRRARSVAVVFGLLTASAVLVNAWHGQIEAHFHFFVMIAIIALYEDWVPFGLAVGYVVAEHGVLGALSPTSVYNHPGNPWVWAAIHGGFVLAAVGASVVTWRLNEDMRARMGESDRQARETAERFRHAFEGGVSGMALVGADGRYLQVNHALSEMTGYSQDELLATTFQAITHPDDLPSGLEQHRAIVAGTYDTFETEKRYVHREGHEVWVQLGVSAIRGENGEVRYFIAQTHDVTQQRRFQDELAHRALHDPLTGLPNRALFRDRLHHALVRMRRHSAHVAVLFVDLDRFKLVNDGMGHAAGDAVLLEAARRLTEAARAEDTIARFGGDEFTILCDDAGEEGARMVADRVMAAFTRPFEADGREFHLSASVGIRVNDLATADPDTLLRDADVALYCAKENGRGRIEVFDADARMAGVDTLATEQELRLAIRHEELELHYQPEVDLTNHQIVALEALVRWQHPQRGLVPPGEFIPVAEESGLIVAMGEWILGEACRQLAAWRARGVVGPEVRVAVNVSARQLSHADLPATVEAALLDAELPPSALCLEITETAIIRDTKAALSNLERIKALGVFIALDDFGVGFSSLSQIRELPPVDVIKVDRSFTAGLGRNESDDAVVGAVLSLAASLGLTAVAEGVESLAQLGHLRGLGCDVGQGFYFARPRPPEEIEKLLAEGIATQLPATGSADGALA
jgi:diguanylate cyclase (GGDEF)-like protein/PAS domain S-box-containing protein